MPAKTTRIRLSAEQKLALYNHHSQHPELSLRALAAWTGSTFKLRKPPSPAAVLMLLKHPVAEDDARSNPTRRANQLVHYLPLEKALVRWIVRCEQLKMPIVTWATIRAKAEKIRRVLVQDAEHASNTKLRKMAFSDGWIQKLQERHSLKPRRVHGEVALARVVDVEEGRAALQIITSKYRYRDIFNMDESAYFYCTAFSTSVSRSSVAGRKKIKKRLTVATTTKANGSFKVPLLLWARRKNHAKGWMTTQLFRTSLGYFNETMRSEERQVLLLDNASPHHVTEHYSHVTLHFLPPNTTAHLQPQDAGIIKSFKSQLNRTRDVTGRRARYLAYAMRKLLEGGKFNSDCLSASGRAHEAHKATNANADR